MAVVQAGRGRTNCRSTLFNLRSPSMKLATCALAFAFGGLVTHLLLKYGDVSADSEGVRTL
jgi:hypothetical protein